MPDSPYDLARREAAAGPEQEGEVQWPPAQCDLPAIDGKRAAKYRKVIVENAEALLGARFGPFWAEPPLFPDEGYDKTYFKLVPVDEGRNGLALVTGAKASQGFAAIRKSPSKWRLDCAAFARLCLSMACEQWVGSKKFDARFGPASFYFSQLRGAATIEGHRFERKDQSYLLSKYAPDGQFCDDGGHKEDSLIATVPVGSLFLFRNDDVPAEGKQAFRFEHAINLGAGVFAAHGISATRNLVSLDELREGLARVTYKEGGESLAQYARRTIWLRAVHCINIHFVAEQ